MVYTYVCTQVYIVCIGRVYNLVYLFILENFHYVFAITSSSLKLQVNKLNVDFVANKFTKVFVVFQPFFLVSHYKRLSCWKSNLKQSSVGKGGLKIKRGSGAGIPFRQNLLSLTNKTDYSKFVLITL